MTKRDGRIAAVVSFDERPLSVADLRWGDQRAVVLSPERGVSLGASSSALTAVSPTGSAVVVDSRLDDVDDLAARLRPRSTWLSREPTPAELVVAALDELGDRCVDLLRGDFAFVAWDARRRRVVVVRDPFGGRATFYGSVRGSVVVASEVKQLVGRGLLPPEPDDEQTVEFLADCMSSTERTFIRGVRRLVPGHMLEVTARGHRTARWWIPDFELDRAGDAVSRFAVAFDLAVHRRTADRRAAAHVSGGLDSSSVSLVADAAPTRPVVGVAHRYPGFAADNAQRIDDVAARLSYPVERLDVTSADPFATLDDVVFVLDAPVAWPERLVESEHAVLESFGADVVLTGLGADEVLFEDRHLADLMRTMRLPTLARQAIAVHRFSPTPVTWWLRDAARSAVPPVVRRTARRWVPRRPRSAPSWLRPDAAGRAILLDTGSERRLPEARSLTQQGTIEYVAAPRLVWALESYGAEARHHGHEITHPLFDRDLVEAVLRIPFDQRLPTDGWKHLLRSAMRARLPQSVITSPKIVLDDYEVAVQRRAATVLLDEAASDADWPLGDLVVAAAARSLGRDCLETGQFGRDVWRLVCLARWRRVLADRYW